MFHRCNEALTVAETVCKGDKCSALSVYCYVLKQEFQ